MSDSPNGRNEPFLARWSRRKQTVAEAREAEDRRVAEELAAADGELPDATVPEPQQVPPGLPAVETLTPQSDFTRFMQPDVPSTARTAAVKKLFTDPHFNVMDGLDIYIDDYTRPDPIPAAMLRDLAQSRMLRLFDDVDEVAEASGGAVPAGAPARAAEPAPPGEVAAAPVPGAPVADAREGSGQPPASANAPANPPAHDRPMSLGEAMPDERAADPSQAVFRNL